MSKSWSCALPKGILKAGARIKINNVAMDVTFIEPSVAYKRGYLKREAMMGAPMEFKEFLSAPLVFTIKGTEVLTGYSMAKTVLLKEEDFDKVEFV